MLCHVNIKNKRPTSSLEAAKLYWKGKWTCSISTWTILSKRISSKNVIFSYSRLTNYFIAKDYIMVCLTQDTLVVCSFFPCEKLAHRLFITLLEAFNIYLFSSTVHWPHSHSGAQIADHNWHVIIFRVNWLITFLVLQNLLHNSSLCPHISLIYIVKKS